MKIEDKFFNQIEETLHSYQEEYIPGAWEEFLKRKKRRRALIFKLSSAAAILLLFSYITAQFLMKPVVLPGEGNQVKTKLQPKKNIPEKTNNSTGTEHKVIAMGQTAPYPEKALIRKKTNVAPNYAVLPGTHNNVAVTDKTADVVNKPELHIIAQQPLADTSSVNPVAPVIAKKTEAKKIEKVTGSVYDDLAKSKANSLKNGQKVADRQNTEAKNHQKNILYSIVLSPSVGNQRMNFGTGLEVAYKINENLFVSSGISYSAINAATNGSNNLTADNKQILGANLSLSGFEVPIGLQYKTKAGFYASAGVSAMAVVKNHLEYNYVNEGFLLSDAMSSDGTSMAVYRVASEKKTSESTETINRYLGFYTISVGKKQKFGNNQLNIGPFVKIPFGGVSSENIKLMQGGIHVGIGF